LKRSWVAYGLKRKYGALLPPAENRPFYRPRGFQNVSHWEKWPPWWKALTIREEESKSNATGVAQLMKGTIDIASTQGSWVVSPGWSGGQRRFDGEEGLMIKYVVVI